jgi:hypothetical protein
MKVKVKRRDRHEITQDLGQVQLDICHALAPLTGGGAAEELVDVPGQLVEAAGKLQRLARELDATLSPS